MPVLHSLWDLFWLFFWIFAFIAYLFALFAVIRDLFRDGALSGWWKALWVIFMVFLPFLTVLVYVIVRGGSMAERSAREQVAQERLGQSRPVISKDRSRYIFYANTVEVLASASPRVLNRPHMRTALVEIPEGGAEGVLVSQGGVDGGFSFYLQSRRLRYSYNYVTDQHFTIDGDTDVPSGRHALSMEFNPTGAPDLSVGKGAPGTVRLFIDGEAAGHGELPVTIPIMMGLAAGVSVGADVGAPVTERTPRRSGSPAPYSGSFTTCPVKASSTSRPRFKRRSPTSESGRPATLPALHPKWTTI